MRINASLDKNIELFFFRRKLAHGVFYLKDIPEVGWVGGTTSDRLVK